MKIKHIYEIISNAMNELDNVDCVNNISLKERILNQKRVHKAYKLLDTFKDELIRENVKLKEVQKK